MKKDILATLQCNICGCTHIENAKGLPKEKRLVVPRTYYSVEVHNEHVISSRCENCDLDDTGHCVIKLEVARG